MDYFQQASPPTLEFPAGSSVTNDRTTSTSRCFTVPIIDDPDFDPGETFILGLMGETGFIAINDLLPESQATVMINDNDVGEKHYTLLTALHVCF